MRGKSTRESFVAATHEPPPDESSHITTTGKKSFPRLHKSVRASFLTLFTVAKNTKIVFLSVDKELLLNSDAFQCRAV